MTKFSFYATYLALFLVLSPWAHGQQAGSPPSAVKPRALAIPGKPWSGDFDQMVERRQIRVLVPFSRTLYFNDKGRERGLTADLVRDFERYINQKYKTGNRPITVYLTPTTRDKLLSGVNGGLGDIAAGNLTVTEERLKAVDFVAPKDLRDVSELVITGPKSPAIAVVEDLAGKTVHVRKASSYYESLVALNERFRQAGKPEVKLTLVPDALEDEDMLEMLNAGLLEAIVVDDWKAKMWAQVLPKVKVNEAVAVHSGGKIGWAIRKGSPKLEAAINDFYTNFVKKQGLVEYRFKQSYKRVKQIKDPTGTAESKRFEQTLALFQKYGEKYGFDALMLAAQGFQESQLDQNAKSHVGAIGVMQVMPATGAELKVGDVRAIEPNIHAGAKYMDQLMTRYFTEAKFDEQNRTLFAFAAYNCGPGNMAKMRKEAAKRSLDQDHWFNNVELVTAEKIGVQTTTYVRNIYKYYVSYKLFMDAGERQQKAREQLAPGKS
jgi:membrane-bound lytic murein transglycosylase MltF